MNSKLKGILSALVIVLSISIVIIVAFSNKELGNAWDTIRQMDLIWLAGLYRMEGELPVFVILTRPADERLAWMHDRMPVMLPKASVGEWIRPDGQPAPIVQNSLTRVRWEQAI